MCDIDCMLTLSSLFNEGNQQQPLDIMQEPQIRNDTTNGSQITLPYIPSISHESGVFPI